MIIAFKGDDSNIYDEDNNNNCKKIYWIEETAKQCDVT